MRNRINIYLLATGAFLTAVAELVVAGILNVIAEDMDISIALAGQLITAYSLAFAIGTPIVVALTSRMGRKKVLIGALVTFILGCLAAYGSSEVSVLIVSRLILGLSAGVYLVVAMSSVAKLVPAEKIGSAMGTLALGFSLAMVLGVPIGIAITNWFSWQVVFLLLGAVSLLILLGIIRKFPEINGDAPVSFRQQIAVFENVAILGGLLLSFLWSTGNSVMFTYLAPFLEEIFQLKASDIGMVMFGFGIFGVVGSRLGGYGVDKWGTARMLAMGLAFPTVSLAFLPLFDATFIGSLVLISVWVSSMFVTAPALNTYFVQQAPQSANLVLSLNTSFTHLGLAIGAGAGGMLVNSASTVLYNPWLASLAVALAFITATFSFSRGSKVVSGAGS